MTESIRVAFTTSILVLGIVSGPSAAQATAAAPAPMKGSYTVPTTDTALEPYATFETADPENGYGAAGKEGVFTFVLPEELTGVAKLKFLLEEQADGSWAGEGVKGTCVQSKLDWFCSVEFSNLTFDTVRRETLMQNKYGTGEEFFRRMEVARSFEGQPIGVIRVPLASVKTIEEECP